MSNLTVWKFDSPGGGVSAGARVDTMAREGAVQLTDAATVEWAEDQAKPQTNQLMGRFAKGTMGRSFWRATFDLLLSGEQPENRAGEIPEFTGVSDPYEAPEDAEVVVDGGKLSPLEAAEAVLRWLEGEGYLAPASA